MIKQKTAIIILLNLISNLGFSQYTDVINSNRPGESMSAFAVGKTIFQAELGVAAIREKHNTLQYVANGVNSDLAVRYGLFASEIEVILNLQYQNDEYVYSNNITNRQGLKRTLFGLKALIFDPYKKEKKIDLYSWKRNHEFKWSSLIPAVSVYAGLNLNFSNNDFLTQPESLLDPKIMIITQNQFENSQVFVMNFYFDKMTSYSSTFGYILTYTKGFNDHWSGFIENKGFKSSVYSDAIFTGGAAYLFKKNTQIDISVSKSIKNTPSLLYGGLGISWRFDENYKTEKIKVMVKKKKKKNKIIQPNSVPTQSANPSEIDEKTLQEMEQKEKEQKENEIKEPVATPIPLDSTVTPVPVNPTVPIVPVNPSPETPKKP